MQEIPHTKHKTTKAKSRQKYSKCKGISKYKNRRIKTYYRQKLGGGWKYRIGTVSYTYHSGIKHLWLYGSNNTLSQNDTCTQKFKFRGSPILIVSIIAD